MIDGNTKVSDLLDVSETQNELEHKAHEHGAIDKDFYEKLPEWQAFVLDRFDNLFYGRPWFEEAWQKYRSHVMDSEMKNIRAPGYIFNDYIKKDHELNPKDVRYNLEGDYYLYPELRSEKERKEDMREVCYSEEDINSLKHYGVKGQQWGVRRFQNADGTLTEEGRARYGAQVEKIISQNKGKVSEKTATKVVLDKAEQAEQEQYVRKAAEASQAAIKSVNDIGNGVKAVGDGVRNMIPDKPGTTIRGTYPDLSDQELKRRIQRIQDEQRYSDLKGDTKYVKSGQEKAREAIQTLTGAVGLATAVAGLIIAIRNK